MAPPNILTAPGGSFGFPTSVGMTGCDVNSPPPPLSSALLFGREFSKADDNSDERAEDGLSVKAFVNPEFVVLNMSSSSSESDKLTSRFIKVGAAIAEDAAAVADAAVEVDADGT